MTNNADSDAGWRIEYGDLAPRLDSLLFDTHTAAVPYLTCVTTPARRPVEESFCRACGYLKCYPATSECIKPEWHTAPVRTNP